MTPDKIAAEFEPGRKSVGRTQDAVRDLDEACRAFFSGDNARNVGEIDPDSGEFVREIVSKNPRPDSLS